jgi:hypothetical protein
MGGRMTSYLYKTRIWKDTTNVIGVDPAVEAANKTDFETNYKSSAIGVSSIEIAETTFITDLTYTEFKAKITGDITWGDVKYSENSRYDLYIITNSPI